MTGGAVQGSVLGVMDHNAMMEGVDDEEMLTECHKYVDDLTNTETLGPDSDSYVDGKQMVQYHALDCLDNLTAITSYCTNHGLKVNEQKTQLLAIT